MLLNIFTEIGKGTAPFPAKLICCHGEGLAELIVLITEYTEVFASHPVFTLKTPSFPVIKHLLQNNQHRPAPSGVLSVRSRSAL